MQNLKGLMYFVAAAGLAASVASGQEACTPAHTTNGPDVIVGDIQEITNYAVSGTIDAISLGTTSCNIGNVNVNWIQTTNQHPVVGQNLFKYKVSNYSGAGTNSYARFEQIGQSWLKHTFAAFDQGLCCTDCASQGGLYSFLRVHCSDPYTSSRNGSQSGLGPKWQVNAHTGAFPYPFANPSFTGSVMRRLEYQLSDAEPSNGSTLRYFGECQYVTLDDATQGNQNNNTSYREASMTITGTFPNASASNVTLLGSGATRSTLAIHAWKLIDPSVTETDMALTETSGGPTGRVMMSSKATDLGNGYWHYEFAIHNQNSDVSVGKVTIPLPAAALVQNIGFHDVTYRDGDGIANVSIDGTDWPSTRSGDTISWATTPFASNNNGNGLRWGTLYNFRFDANVAPNLAGIATLTSWKTIVDFGGAAQVPGVLPVSCYANCDASTTAPCLNVLDFSCFLNRFAAGDSYANCDNSTTPPVLNVLDFSCFLNAFASGCTNC